MFSNYTKKIQLMLANFFMKLADYIFRRINNKKHVITSELSLDTESSPDLFENIAENTETNEKILTNDSCGAAVKNLNNESGRQEKTHIPENFSREIEDKNLNGKRKIEYADIKETTLPKNISVVNDTIGDSKYAISDSKDVTLNKQILVKEENGSNEDTTSSKNPPIDMPDYALCETKSHSEKLFNTSFPINNEYIETSGEVAVNVPEGTLTLDDNLSSIEEGITSNEKHGEGYNGFSTDPFQQSVYITTNTYSELNAAQLPDNTESNWPSLSGKTTQETKSQKDMTSYRWPELATEVTATGLGLYSSGIIHASKSIVREMKHIRNLEKEQKGMLWNA